LLIVYWYSPAAVAAGAGAGAASADDDEVARVGEFDAGLAGNSMDSMELRGCLPLALDI
jgi:hypothetical protein